MLCWYANARAFNSNAKIGGRQENLTFSVENNRLLSINVTWYPVRFASESIASFAGGAHTINEHKFSLRPVRFLARSRVVDYISFAHKCTSYKRVEIWRWGKILQQLHIVRVLRADCFAEKCKVKRSYIGYIRAKGWCLAGRVLRSKCGQQQTIKLCIRVR